ncbi:hypothetical protein BRC72_02105 [Halobacteriales archaeon QH_7_66_36]|nr:MAG: hypothetical protein BRC72_02105 [Halobacteriales archaeon QH_7_66_36]
MSDAETQRVGVRTYVPRFQKSEWAEEAAALDMSQAEFVRTMVQAGRRSFQLDESDGPTDRNVDETRSGDATPRVDGLQDRLLGLLDSSEHLSWDELIAGLTDDIEDRLDAALSDLQEQGRVTHSGRHGGYTLVNDGE